MFTDGELVGEIENPGSARGWYEFGRSPGDGKEGWRLLAEAGFEVLIVEFADEFDRAAVAHDGDGRERNAVES